LRAQCGKQGFCDVGDQSLIVESIRERAHHDGGPVAIIVRIAIHVTCETQGFQYAIGGGARQADGGGQRVDRGALQPIQFGENIEAAIERANRTRGFAADFLIANSR
jgi:hypothetical protein